MTAALPRHRPAPFAALAAVASLALAACGEDPAVTPVDGAVRDTAADTAPAPDAGADTATAEDTASGPDTGACAPACAGRVCGDDGCGGSCGSCGPGLVCGGDGECALGCADTCGPAGATACNRDGVVTCGSFDEDPCLEWGPVVACSAWETCVGGACACAPACGGAKCGDDGCGNACGACAEGTTCSNGQCSTSCVDECAEGAQVCAGFGFRVCGQHDADPCRDWGPAQACASGSVCSGGACACAASCAGRVCGADGCGGSCGGCGAGQMCDEAGRCVCEPSCAGKVCGGDGCGGSCGSCGPGQACTAAGQCACQPSCVGKVCGGDGCGGSCGSCGAGQACTAAGQCACQPNCVGKVCGSDGCGGSCGGCGAGQACSAAGQCVCQPSCAGKVCGSDGCGGSCGSCGAGQTCGAAGQCVCQASCAGKVCGDDGCGGSCGSCSGGSSCVGGACVAPCSDACASGARTCSGNAWQACGQHDADACLEWGPLTSCPAGSVCAGGSCVCQPACAGRACGGDGCGGSCGTCGAGTACNGAGQCQCVPSCAGKSCGPDGCGGVCGTCTSTQVCTAAGQCQCAPQCSGKVCGADGCGGSCGTCGAGTTCNGAGQCQCVPNCAGKSCGSDGCGGSCGTCGAGTACNGSGQCQCAPDCTGRTCGDDGCGGACGTCSAAKFCYASTSCKTPWSGTIAELPYGDLQGEWGTDYYRYAPAGVVDGYTLYLYLCANTAWGQVRDKIVMRKYPVYDPSSFEGETVAVSYGAAGSWDALHACDPTVAKGTFLYTPPGGSQQTYSYVLFYTGMNKESWDGGVNQVGFALAKSLDGPWVKVTTTAPLITATQYWGVGQPSVTSIAGGDVLLFYTRGDAQGNRTIRQKVSLGNANAPVLYGELVLTARGLTKDNGTPDGELHGADFYYDGTTDRFRIIRPLHPFPTTCPTYISSGVQVASIPGIDVWNGGGAWKVEQEIRGSAFTYPRVFDPGWMRTALGTPSWTGGSVYRALVSTSQSCPNERWSYRVHMADVTFP